MSKKPRLRVHSFEGLASIYQKLAKQSQKKGKMAKNSILVMDHRMCWAEPIR